MTNVSNRAYKLWKDIGERATWTFVQAFVAVEGFDTFASELLDGRLNLDWLNTAKIAGIAAVLSVLKGFVASQFGPPTAALPAPK